MSEAATPTQVVLHIWPRQSPALSLDPPCVAALSYLQQIIPGQFSLSYCMNPDLSPSGQLPFLTHGHHSIATLPSIVKYISHLPGARDVDGALSTVGKAQSAARLAQVQSEYGDLVSHMLYCVHDNWWKTTRPALVSMLPVPQRYYVPNRLRELQKERLEFAGLWDISGVEQEEQEDQFASGKRKKKTPGPDKFKKVFERERVLEKARAFFDIYAKMLGDRQLFHPRSNSPTSLDLMFAAHTHILMNLPFTDMLLPSLLSDSYPSLVTHAITVQELTFPDSLPFPTTVQACVASGWQSLIPWARSASTAGESKPPSHTDEEERRFSTMRWGWVGLSAAALALYIHLTGLRLVLEFDPREDETVVLEGNEAEDEEDDDEEEE